MILFFFIWRKDLFGVTHAKKPKIRNKLIIDRWSKLLQVQEDHLFIFYLFQEE